MANRNQEKYPAENDFPNLDKTTAMLKDCMPLDVYAKLRDVYTPSGFTLDRAIQSCVDLPTTEKIGIVAGDEESYAVFAEVFDNIIEKRHGIKLSECINKTDLDPKKITGCVLDEKYVISSRVRTSRNLRGYCLSPFCCRSERREVERILSDALTTISNGEYHPLVTMDECLRQTLVNDHYLFRTPTTGFQLSAGCARDWPDARGIWYNEDKSLIFWVNEEDHLRIISMQMGGDMKEVFTRFCDGINQVEKTIKLMNREFMFNDKLGYINTCPSNIGTGLRASVHIRLPRLTNHPAFKGVVTKLNLECRGLDGEESGIEGGVQDISNELRLGYSEVYLVQSLIDSINLLTEMETRLENDEDIDNLLPM